MSKQENPRGELLSELTQLARKIPKAGVLLRHIDFLLEFITKNPEQIPCEGRNIEGLMILLPFLVDKGFWKQLASLDPTFLKEYKELLEEDLPFESITVKKADRELGSSWDISVVTPNIDFIVQFTHGPSSAFRDFFRSVGVSPSGKMNLLITSGLAPYPDNENHDPSVNPRFKMIREDLEEDGFYFLRAEFGKSADLVLFKGTFGDHLSINEALELIMESLIIIPQVVNHKSISSILRK